MLPNDVAMMAETEGGMAAGRRARRRGRLLRKCETFRAVTGTKDAVHLTLVTTEGVSRNTHSGIVQSEVKLDDLFM